MGSYDFRGRSLLYFERLVSSLVLASLPIQGFSDSQFGNLKGEVLYESEIQGQLLSKFSEIKKSFRSCENRNLEAIKSIQSLLDEVALNYNMTLSLNDFFETAKIKLTGMNFDQNTHLLLTQVINNFEMTNYALMQTVTETITEPLPIQHLHSKHFEVCGYGIYPPWEWSWFGYNKKDHKTENQQCFIDRQVTYPGPIPIDDGSIPDDLIICGVEAMVIVLLLIIPSGYTQILAGAIAYDMGSRAIDGVKEISELNREKQREFNP